MAMGLFTLVALQPLSALAEVKAGSFEVTPFGGFSIFENKQNLKDRPIYGGRFGYNFTNHFGIETTVEFINSRVDDRSKTGTAEGEYRSPTDKVDLGFYHIDAVYHLLPESVVTPYIVAGVGGAHYRPRISNRDLTAVNFGGGAKIWVTEHVALRLDLRDNLVLDETYHNISATAGLVLALGGTPAVAPPAAAKPAATETAKDSTAPYVTLTSPFNGSTDVPLQRKLRVAFSESIDPATINGNTFVLKQGDTIIPGTVATPTDKTASFTQSAALAPGTLYTGWVTTGVRDLAGNPLAKDYVWSFQTAATAEPKTISRVETKTIFVNKLVMLEDAHFEFDKATLTPAGKEVLLQNSRIMKDNPDLKVRIAGYTSASGSNAYNQDLSERRADNVMTFMLNDGGIAPERLDTIGYGETRPAVYEVNPAELESKAAKANMRVLFEIIVK
jgi:outer membrane beta-barrel protein